MARLFHVGLLLLTATVLRADSLASVQLARALLGPSVWSRVLHLENRRTEPRHPAQFHALVFAIEDRLWLYNPIEGTQSLSLYAGRLEQDEADLAPLLRIILPGLVRFQDVTSEWPEAPAPVSAASLPFGCFIKCFVRWRALQGGLSPPEEAGLLAYYFGTSAGRHGHTVLVYREKGRRYVYDPADGDSARLLPAWQAPTPLQEARYLCTFEKPVMAQQLALHRAGPPRELATAAAAPASPSAVAAATTSAVASASTGGLTSHVALF